MKCGAQIPMFRNMKLKKARSTHRTLLGLDLMEVFEVHYCGQTCTRTRVPFSQDSNLGSPLEDSDVDMALDSRVKDSDLARADRHLELRLDRVPFLWDSYSRVWDLDSNFSKVGDSTISLTPAQHKLVLTELLAETAGTYMTNRSGNLLFKQ
jgi:hypothetical protein